VANKKILVVDDEPHIVDLVKVCLEDRDFEVLEAYNGGEALEKIRQFVPDMVLLDIMMPEVDGYEVCRQIKQTSETQHIKVVMLTAKGLEIDRATGLECGADSYITKPFSPIRLLSEIRELLEVA